MLLLLIGWGVGTGEAPDASRYPTRVGAPGGSAADLHRVGGSRAVLEDVGGVRALPTRPADATE